jgi:hypothetical protein
MNADLLSVLLAAILSITSQVQENSMNTLLAIAPFFKHGTWVFTDERRNLVEEPFVAGVPEIITEIVADIPNAKAGFRLTFSAGPFPGHELVAIFAVVCSHAPGSGSARAYNFSGASEKNLNKAGQRFHQSLCACSECTSARRELGGTSGGKWGQAT